MIPASIQSLVQARMDRLAPRDRQAFQTAAVIGQRFDLVLLRRLIAAPDYACDVLVGNALVLPEGDDYLFAHALIQEGAYSSLLRSRRRELHLQAAEWFADRDLCFMPSIWTAPRTPRARRVSRRRRGRAERVPLRCGSQARRPRPADRRQGRSSRPDMPQGGIAARSRRHRIVDRDLPGGYRGVAR